MKKVVKVIANHPFLTAIVGGALVLVLSRLLIWQIVSVSGHSMDPTLTDKEHLLMVKHLPIDRYDIVVAESKDKNNGDHLIVKRVIGLPGDTIKIEYDNLYINNVLVDEKYIAKYKTLHEQKRLASVYDEINDSYGRIAMDAEYFTRDALENSIYEVTLKDNEYLLLGDNRLLSKDNRHTGPTSVSKIVGEIIWSFQDNKKPK